MPRGLDEWAAPRRFILAHPRSTDRCEADILGIPRPVQFPVGTEASRKTSALRPIVGWNVMKLLSETRVGRSSLGKSKTSGLLLLFCCPCPDHDSRAFGSGSVLKMKNTEIVVFDLELEIISSLARRHGLDGLSRAIAAPEFHRRLDRITRGSRTRRSSTLCLRNLDSATHPISRSLPKPAMAARIHLRGL